MVYRPFSYSLNVLLVVDTYVGLLDTLVTVVICDKYTCEMDSLLRKVLLYALKEGTCRAD